MLRENPPQNTTDVRMRDKLKAKTPLLLKDILSFDVMIVQSAVKHISPNLLQVLNSVK